MAGLARTAEPRRARRRASPVPECGWHYLIALGSNTRHGRHGLPPAVLTAAIARLDHAGLVVERASAWVASAPLVPSRRRYANGAALVRSTLAPPELLAMLKAVEREFGRRRGGRRWGARVLDLDIVLWQGGAWRSGVPAWQGSHLVVPHRHFRERDFVLGPAQRVAPGWRDPVTGLTLRQLAGRRTRAARAHKERIV